VVLSEDGAAAEAVFVGEHIAEFGGVAASGRTVRVPYSVFYDIADDGITALRIYMSLDELMRQITAQAPLAASAS
jgi:predicted ester cyclase